MAQGISLSELSRVTGRAKSGLHKLAKAKRIPQLADGSFDLAAVQKALDSNLDPARKSGSKPVRPAVHRSPAVERSERVNDPIVTTPEEAREAVTLIARILREEGIAGDGEVDFNSARVAETILKARERDLKIAQRRKELVLLSRVKTHVEKAFIGLRQAIQRIPSRHASAMAAELGCDAGALDVALTKAITAELDELSAPVVRA